MKRGVDPLVKNLEVFTAFARKRLGDPELAKDVVQDSLLKALKAPAQPCGEQDVVRWFYRILRRSIIDVYRRREVRKRGLERLEQELPESPDAEAERVVCQCVKRLLPGLPEGYREVLKRVDLEGKSAGETAAQLGLTVNHLNVRLHRARKKLREKVEETCRVCSKHGCFDCTCGE